MTTYFEALDGHGEPTLWFVEDNRPAEVLTRKRNIHDGHWPGVVARMTGTTITTDDATVQRVAQVIWAHEHFLPWPIDLDDDTRASASIYEPTARAILAALTGGAT